MSNIIKTKYGNARLTDEGYWQICSKKEGNQNKMLHRLIYEEHYDIKLRSNEIVHHINGNKTDNSIDNLTVMSFKEHTTHHRTGSKLSDETRKKISKQRRKTSKYYRVAKTKCVSTTQGFLWKYRYRNEEGKCVAITSTTIQKLKEKVLEKGLEWKEVC